MDNFRTKTFEAIEKAIANEEDSTQIYTSWISNEMAQLASNPFTAYLMFSPDGNSETKQLIEKIYDDVSDYVFNKYGYVLRFGGCNSGSECRICKPEECKPEIWEKFKTNALKNIKDMEDAGKTRINSAYAENKCDQCRCTTGEYAYLFGKLQTELPEGYKISHNGMILKI